MRFQSALGILGLGLIFLSCSSVKIKTDYDREYNFAELKTYRWAAAKEINPSDELQKDPLVYKRVVNAVEKALAEKGLKKVEADEPDFVVLAHAGIKERMRVTNSGGYSRGWYDPWWGPYGGTTHVSYYKEATLVVDLVHWENKELAWRGMATGTVRKNQDGDKQQARLNDIAARIFADYPPKK